MSVGCNSQEAVLKLQELQGHLICLIGIDEGFAHQKDKQKALLTSIFRYLEEIRTRRINDR